MMLMPSHLRANVATTDTVADTSSAGLHNELEEVLPKLYTGDMLSRSGSELGIMKLARPLEKVKAMTRKCRQVI